MSKTLKFIKNNGDIQYKEYLLNSLENSFKALANGEYVITISKLVKHRTIDQNKLMWLWFACVEYETGTDKNDVHDYYCGKFLSRMADINGAPERVFSGTSKLTTIGMKDFLDKVQADVNSEFGILLPNPDDLRWKEFEEQYNPFYYDHPRNH